MRKLIEFTDCVEEEIMAVIPVKEGYFCQRCGNKGKEEFFQDQLGVYCQKCLIFGKSSTASLICRTPFSNVGSTKIGLNHMIYLSELQRLASLKCVEAYRQRQDLLIFAVCGAGKTEIVYDVILQAIQSGHRVCFATPRKDVVLELVPRFKRDFHDVDIIALYGGSPDKGKQGQLYVTTTHQLIHFYQFFDLIILDEVDAFPYYNNEMLEGFVTKAKKLEANIILLTATPTKRLKQAMRQGKLHYFIIPSRFHKHPIPVPRVVLLHNTIRQIEHFTIPKKIRKWLNEKKQLGKQIFIFVPQIEWGMKLETILKKDYNCQFVSSESPNRKEIVDSFRKGKIQFIITTTILERGVTVSNVDVCIIKADELIFDERAIVQIVGRSGRDRNHPTSDVVLFADFYTIGIKDAIHHIKQMNRLAEK